MASSTYSDAHEPQQEFDSPFLGETIFTDAAAEQARQARKINPTALALESPFLQEFEQERENTLSEDTPYSEPADDLEETDVGEEAEETFDFLTSEEEDNLEEAFLSKLSEEDEKKLASALDDAQKRFSMPGLNALRPRKILDKLERDRKKVTQHLTNTVELFGTTTRIKPDEIDWPLVQIIAAREIGMTSTALKRTYSSNSNRLINSAGKDTHVDGKGGFDNLYKFRPLFPKKVKQALKSVRTDRCKNTVNPHKEPGFRKGRYNTCPALIPEKYLLVGAIVNVTGSQRGFAKRVRDIFEDPEPLLSNLNQDAKRIWTALTFARPGGSSSPDGRWGVITILHDYKRQLEEGTIADLNAIADDTALREKRPFVMRAAIASAQTSILEKSLPNHIADIFDSSPSNRRPADYSCVRPQVLNRELGQFELDAEWEAEFETEFEAESTACFYLPISSQPIPCRFYTIKYKVDARGLIDLAGRAYGVKPYREKLKLAQWINKHPYNQRFWRTGSQASKSFPNGRISFNPRFTKDIRAQANAAERAPFGRAFATIFIPPPPAWLDKSFSSCLQPAMQTEAAVTEATLEATLEATSGAWSVETELEPELEWERPYQFHNEEFGDELEAEFEEEFEEEFEAEFGDELEAEFEEDPGEDFLAVADAENLSFEPEAEAGSEDPDPFAFSAPESEDEGYEATEYDLDTELDTEPAEDEFLDEPEYQSFLQESSFQGDEDLYEDENPYRSKSKKGKSSSVSKITTKIADSPQPGSFYRIKRGDNLLSIAGKAYGVQPGKKRLAFAQFMNRSALNQKYWIQGKTNFVKRYFSSGIISFYPRFSCNLKDMLEAKHKAPSGKCYAVIWIPPLPTHASRVQPYIQRYIQNEDSFEAESPVEAMLANQLEVRSSEDSFFRQVQDRLHSQAPFRWICVIGSYFPDPDRSGNLIPGSGTGILISPRHVLTAAHVLFPEYLGSGKPPTPARNLASKVTVAFGFHGKGRANRKFLAKYDTDTQKTMKLRVPDEWKANGQNLDYDFAVIDLGQDIDKVVKGYWGGNQNYRIPSVTPVAQKKRALVSVGYPGIKMKQNIYSQWQSLGDTDLTRTRRYRGRFKNLLAHDALIYSGMSGGPVWTEAKTRQSFVRHLMGINSFGQEETVQVNMKDYVKDPGSTSLTVSFAKEHDVAVAMTRTVLDRLNDWGIQV